VPFHDDDVLEVLEGAPLSAPQALQIVEVDPATRQFVLREARLRSILEAREVAHLPAVVISIAGEWVISMDGREGGILLLGMVAWVNRWMS